jgi:hypothetical protein
VSILSKKNKKREFRGYGTVLLISSPVNQPHSHFTELVSDRCKHVGCALIHFTDKNNSNLKVSQLVCNYSFTNIIGEPIYKTGNTGENCASGLSKKWDGLCSRDEAVTPYATGKYGNW